MSYCKRNKEFLEKIERVLDSRLVILIKCQHLSSEEAFVMRQKMWDLSANFMLVKNSLAKIAFLKRGFNYFADDLQGPAALVYSSGDASALLKLVFAVEKDYGDSKISLMGGCCESHEITKGLAQKLANVPSESYVYSDLVSNINFPSTSLLSTLRGSCASVVNCLKLYSSS